MSLILPASLIYLVDNYNAVLSSMLIASSRVRVEASTPGNPWLGPLDHEYASMLMR